MKTQKLGGFAAFYLAAAYIIGIALFLVVLDYPSITDPAQKVSLLIEQQGVIFWTNLLMYVFFGLVLVPLTLALYDLVKTEAPALAKVATVTGIIWAGSLVASGMISNAGIAPVVALYAKDPAQAALTWQTIETVASGIGNGNGEILGGVWTLLISLAALRTDRCRNSSTTSACWSAWWALSPSSPASQISLVSSASVRSSGTSGSASAWYAKTPERNKKMKAIVYERYGSPEVLQIKEVDKPVPGDREILVKVQATTVTIGDTIMRSLNMPVTGLQKVMGRLYLGWSRPKRPILGMELAGTVEAVGRKVTRFQQRRRGFCIHFCRRFWRLCRIQMPARKECAGAQTAQSQF